MAYHRDNVELPSLELLPYSFLPYRASNYHKEQFIACSLFSILLSLQ